MNRGNEWASAYGDLGMVSPGPQLRQVPLDALDPWSSPAGERQPFKPYTQEKLAELADSIRQHGILEAIRVRPRNGKFQILAGHNRSKAAKLAGLTTIPAIVENVDDDQAALILVESNLQHREKLLPSEKAWAYRTRLEVLKRKAGRPQKNSCQVGTNFRSDEYLAESSKDSARQIQRLIRLTRLITPLLDLVDQEKIGLTPAVNLSYLSPDAQQMLWECMDALLKDSVTGAQAKALRETFEAGNLDSPEAIRNILSPPPKSKTRQLKISLDRLAGYFPPNTPEVDMEETIVAALAAYFTQTN